MKTIQIFDAVASRYAKRAALVSLQADEPTGVERLQKLAAA